MHSCRPIEVAGLKSCIVCKSYLGAGDVPPLPEWAQYRDERVGANEEYNRHLIRKRYYDNRLARFGKMAQRKIPKINLYQPKRLFNGNGNFRRTVNQLTKEFSQ